MRDIVVIARDEPGELRRVARALGQSDINIEGLAALTGNGTSVIHVLVEDYERGLLALTAAGLEAKALHDAIVLNLPDRPDALASSLTPLAEAGVNITLSYVAVGVRSATRLVLVVDDPDKARDALRASRLG